MAKIKTFTLKIPIEIAEEKEEIEKTSGKVIK